MNSAIVMAIAIRMAKLPAGGSSAPQVGRDGRPSAQRKTVEETPQAKLEPAPGTAHSAGGRTGAVD
jgi:hypothetical protein